MARPDLNTTVGADTRPLEKNIRAALNKDYKVSLESKGFSQPLGKITGQLGEFEKSLDASNARVLAFGASAGAIVAVQRALKATVASAINVEKKLKDINVLLGASSKSLASFGNELFKIAAQTGQSFDAVAGAATEFARQGLGLEKTLLRTRDALILTRLSSLDVSSSVSSLTAAINSFSKAALNSTEIVNKLANVDASFAVSSADLANALSRVGSAAQDAGVSFDELLAIVTSAQQTTARGGAVIGNSFKTIFTRIQRPKVLDELERLGVTVRDLEGETRPAIQILGELAKTFDGLSSSQRSQVGELVGGVFQINILKAALSDLNKEYSIYDNALQTSIDSTDQALKRNEALNETLSALINKTFTNLQKSGGQVGSDVFGPSIRFVLENLNKALEGGDAESAGEKFGQAVFRGLGKFISGPGLVIAGSALIKIFVNLSRFAADAFKTIQNLNVQSAEQRKLQAGITSVLDDQPAILEKIRTGELNIEDAAQLVLERYRTQQAILRQNLDIVKQIQSRSGVKVKAGKAGKAAGYIPNYFSDSDKKAEEQTAMMLGATSSVKAKKGKGKIGGKSFLMNNQEVEIPNFGKNGDSAVIPTYAGGYIPNFSSIREAYEYPFRMMSRGKPRPVAPKDVVKNSREYELQLLKGGLASLGFTDAKDLNSVFGPNVQADFLAKKGGIPYLIDAKAGYNDAKLSQIEKKGATIAALRKTQPYKNYIQSLGINDADVRTAIIFGNAGVQQAKSLRKAGLMRAGGYVPNFLKSFVPAKVTLRKTPRSPNGVYDGDSLSVNFTPAQEFVEISSRLVGADAYELNTGTPEEKQKGQQAKELLEKRIKETFGGKKDPLDVTDLFKAAGAKDKDKYGRPFFEDDVFKNQLIKLGLAVRYDGKSGQERATKNLTKKSKPKGKAKGFIPNFAEDKNQKALQEAVGRESSRRPLNSVRVSQVPAFRNKENPLGFVVTNTKDEPNGPSDLFARGYVPNFEGGSPVVRSDKGHFLKKEDEQRYRAAAEKVIAQLKSQEITIKEAEKAIQDLGEQHKISKNTTAKYKKELGKSGGSGSKGGPPSPDVETEGANDALNGVKDSANRSSEKLLLLSLIAPQVVSQLENLVGESNTVVQSFGSFVSAGTTAASALESISSVAQQGFGEKGEAFGEALSDAIPYISVFVGIAGAVNTFVENTYGVSSFLGDLEKSLEKQKDGLNKLNQSTSKYLTTNEALNSALTSGTADAKTLAKLYGNSADAIKDLPSSIKSLVLAGSDTESIKEAFAKSQQEQQKAIGRTSLITEIAKEAKGTIGGTIKNVLEGDGKFAKSLGSSLIKDANVIVESGEFGFKVSEELTKAFESGNVNNLVTALGYTGSEADSLAKVLGEIPFEQLAAQIEAATLAEIQRNKETKLILALQKEQNALLKPYKDRVAEINAQLKKSSVDLKAIAGNLTDLGGLEKKSKELNKILGDLAGGRIRTDKGRVEAVAKASQLARETGRGQLSKDFITRTAGGSFERLGQGLTAQRKRFASAFEGGAGNLGTGRQAGRALLEKTIGIEDGEATKGFEQLRNDLSGLSGANANLKLETEKLTEVSKSLFNSFAEGLIPTVEDVIKIFKDVGGNSPVVESSNAPVVESPNGATGFVPNFSAAASERAQAKMGGYNAGAITKVNIPGVGNVTANSAETIKQFPGMSQPAIMPPSFSKAGKNYKKAFSAKHGFNPYAAQGFVPNFYAGAYSYGPSDAQKRQIDINQKTFFEPLKNIDTFYGVEDLKSDPEKIRAAVKAERIKSDYQTLFNLLRSPLFEKTSSLYQDQIIDYIALLSEAQKSDTSKAEREAQEAAKGAIERAKVAQTQANLAPIPNTIDDPKRFANNLKEVTREASWKRLRSGIPAYNSSASSRKIFFDGLEQFAGVPPTNLYKFLANPSGGPNGPYTIKTRDLLMGGGGGLAEIKQFLKGTGQETALNSKVPDFLKGYIGRRQSILNYSGVTESGKRRRPSRTAKEAVRKALVEIEDGNAGPQDNLKRFLTLPSGKKQQGALADYFNKAINNAIERRRTDAQARAAEFRNPSGTLDLAPRVNAEGLAALGFIPNLAGGEALARKTERSLAGSAIRSFDPRIGTYYRSAGQPSNLNALIRRDHPEGLSQAIRNSYSAQHGTTPNFAADTSKAMEDLTVQIQELVSLLKENGQLDQAAAQTVQNTLDFTNNIGDINIEVDANQILANFQAAVAEMERKLMAVLKDNPIIGQSVRSQYA